MCAREDIDNQSSQLQEVRSDLAAFKNAMDKKLDALLAKFDK